MISISPTADPEHQPKGNHPMTAQISPTALTVDGGVDLLLPRETPLEVLDAFVASCNVGACAAVTTRGETKSEPCITAEVTPCQAVLRPLRLRELAGVAGSGAGRAAHMYYVDARRNYLGAAPSRARAPKAPCWRQQRMVEHSEAD